MNEHLSIDELAAFVCGGLDDAATTKVESHLAGCATCCTLLDSLPDDPLAMLARSAATQTDADSLRPSAADASLGATQSMGPVYAVDTADAHSAAEPVAAPPARYRPVRFHAKGGLGEVHIALDTELSRQVALKRLQDRRADDPASRRRFLLEAEITGRLEHPGIVPVYGLVRGDDGRPCYAMRLVEGETLKQAVERFHDADKPDRDPGERSLALRHLLSSFIAVCNTIAYAHSRGIIHRDIKPANVMLGKYGETLVVDWGLAKAVQAGGSEPALGEEALRPHTSGPADGTQLGQVVGTPGFLSPEQAAGQWDAVGPASDVYSLGATLYVLLTGQLPVDGQEATEILERARRGEVVPPRQRKADLPRALEAVCLKALATRPGDRYAGALDLAADVEKWLADEPVRGWQEPWSLKARRWLGRHRAVLGGAVATVAALACSLGVAAALLSAANDRERQAKEQAVTALALEREAHTQAEARRQEASAARSEAEQQRRVAETNRRQAEAAFLRARNAVDQMFAMEHMLSEAIDVVGVETAPATPLSRERRALLEKALKFYQEALAGAGEEPVLRQEMGRTCSRVGDIQRLLGRPAEAEEVYRQAIAMLSKLLADDPAQRGPRRELARAYNHLGLLLRQVGRNTEAEAAYRTALGVAETLYLTRKDGAAPDKDPGLVANVVTSRSGGGSANPLPPRTEVAKMEFVDGKTTGRELGDVGNPDELVSILNNLASLRRSTGRLAEAVADYQRALAAAEKLVRDEPAVPSHRNALATACNNLAMAYYEQARYAQAEPLLRRALALREAVGGKQTAEYALVLNNLGMLLHARGRYKDAVALDGEALRIRTQVLGENHPDSIQSLTNLGIVYQDMGDYAHALPLLRRALELQQQVLGADHPGTVRLLGNVGMTYLRLGEYKQAGEALRQDLARRRLTFGEAHPETARGLNNVARVLAVEGDYRDALPLCQQAVTLSVQLYPKDRYPHGHPLLADSLDNLAVVYEAQGDTTKAITFFRRAGDIRAELLGTDHPAYAQTLEQLATVHYVRGDYAEANKLNEQALEIARRTLGERHPRTAELVVHRAAALAHLGRPDEAVAQTEAALRQAPATPGLLYDAARVYALAADGSRAGRPVPSPPSPTPAPPDTQAPPATGVEMLSPARPEQRATAGGYQYIPSPLGYGVYVKAPARADYRVRAVELLNEATRAGYIRTPAQRDRLQKDRDLEAVRQLPQFRELVQTLEGKPVKPAKSGNAQATQPGK